MLTKRVMSLWTKKSDKTSVLCVKSRKPLTKHTSLIRNTSLNHNDAGMFINFNSGLLSGSFPDVKFIKGKIPRKHIQYYYVLCDVPEIKNFDAPLTYNILENSSGVIAFTSRHNLEFLRSYIKHPYHVVELNESQLLQFLEAGNRKGVAIHNCYSDIYEQKTYFIFHEL